MEIYFHTGLIENPALLIDSLGKKYSLRQKTDKRFPGYTFYVSQRGVEISINSKYIRLADDCPFYLVERRKVIPSSSPLRPVLEDLIQQFGSKRRIVTVVQEPVALA